MPKFGEFREPGFPGADGDPKKEGFAPETKKELIPEFLKQQGIDIEKIPRDEESRLSQDDIVKKVFEMEVRMQTVLKAGEKRPHDYSAATLELLEEINNVPDKSFRKWLNERYDQRMIFPPEKIKEKKPEK